MFDEIFLSTDIRRQVFCYLCSQDVVRLSWTSLLWIKEGVSVAKETENLDLHLRCNKSKKERDTWNAFFRRERPSSSAGTNPEHIDMQVKLQQFVSFAKVSGKAARRLTTSIELPFARDMQAYSRTLTDLFSTLSTFKNLLLLDLSFSDVLFLKEFSEALVICVEMEGCLCGNLNTLRVSTRDRKAGPEASGILLALEKGAFPMLQNLKLSGFNLSRLHGAPEVTLLLKQALLSRSLENLKALELNGTKLGDMHILFESFDMVPSSRALNILDLRSTGPAMYSSFARVLLNGYLPGMTYLGIDFQAMPTILDMLEGNNSALSTLRVLNLHVELSTFPSALYITQRYHSFYDVRSCAPISARFVRLISVERDILPSLQSLSFEVAPARWKKKTEPPPVSQGDIDAIRYAFEEVGRQVQVTFIDLLP